MAELTKVLIVDDNPKYLEEVLPYYGYDVVCARNGEQALHILDNSTFDIVLSEIIMPKKNGWDTLKAIRNSSKLQNIPIIMVTVISDPQKMVKALKMGADDYIVKPFLLPNLLARMEAVLRRSKLSKNEDILNNVTNNQAKNLNTLTEREKDVLLLLARGANNKDIAEKLVLSPVTVKSHLNRIYKKLNVRNRIQAIFVAISKNKIEL